MAYCPNCGRFVNEGDNFCPNCGKDLVNKKDDVSYTHKEKDVVEAEVVDDDHKYKDEECKSKILAGLLQILLPFGIGRFYLSYTEIGLAQLLLSFIGIGEIWSFIDGIYILLDGVKYDKNGKRVE